MAGEELRRFCAKETTPMRHNKLKREAMSIFMIVLSREGCDGSGSLDGMDKIHRIVCGPRMDQISRSAVSHLVNCVNPVQALWLLVKRLGRDD